MLEKPWSMEEALVRSESNPKHGQHQLFEVEGSWPALDGRRQLRLRQVWTNEITSKHFAQVC
jgi:hypothetical protein